MAPPRPPIHPRHRSRAFTLVEMLIVIAVVALLSSIMMPALRLAIDTGRRTVCSSNLRQIGVGLHDFALQKFPNIEQGHLPPSHPSGAVIESDESNYPTKAQEMMAATHGLAETPGDPLTKLPWDGLGYLLANHCLEPRLLYCPCHRGDHPYLEDGQQLATMAAPGSSLVGQPMLYINYHYRVGLDDALLGENWSSRNPTAVVVSDGMRSLKDFNHIDSSNLLRVDGSVRWMRFENGIIDGIPTSGVVADGMQAQVNEDIKEIWRIFDKSSDSH